jgi:hypothetical protein
MNANAIKIAVCAAVGAVIGGVIGDVTHLTGYWPYLVVAVCAGAGVFIAQMVWQR